MVIIDCVFDVAGWSPIHHLVNLASQALEARVVRPSRDEPSFSAKLFGAFRSRRRRHNPEACLLIAQGPSDLNKVLNLFDWQLHVGAMAAWIIDSFWVDHIPRFARHLTPFDHYFVTCLDDVSRWQRITGVPTTWLPWGTDALDLGSHDTERPWDIFRLGRQPPEWDNDLTNQSAAVAHGLVYQGRLPGHNLSGLDNQKTVMAGYGRAKYLLAFSNAVNPGPQTHPTREYLTGRWVDALACGATVAGIAPRCADAESLLWEGATLDLATVQRQKGIDIIARAVEMWEPTSVLRNHIMALKNLDWRLRLRTIAEKMSMDAPVLRTELERLSAAITALQNSPSYPQVPKD